MKSILKSLAAIGLVSVGLAQSAFADNETFNNPEPGSLALVGLAVAVGLFVARRKK